MKRELSAYFSSPIAYIVGCFFLVFSGFTLFSTFFIIRQAELRNFFQMLPVIFSLFIPALTMRVFSEEKRSGSFETLLTLPVSTVDIVTGKYLATLVAALLMLVPTLSFVVTCRIFGSPDMGPIVGGYIGSILLCAAFTAIGIYASSTTRNQIIAFFVAFAICIVLSAINNFAVLLPGSLVNFASFISSSSHFESISRGIVDTRDILYFVSLAAVFFVLTVRSIENSRRG
ncbi:MAG: ABC-2 transporter permease [Treponema sp.]|nr:ABC-2 transporter permease [Treponema sp.]